MIVMESMGERLGTAGLNTLVCIGVVFVVLIFISFVISLFRFIPKAEAAIAAKKAAKKESGTASAEAIDNTISQIEAKEEKEQLTDDLELVAVIAAAIAASTGASPDGFVVRSIRKVKR